MSKDVIVSPDGAGNSGEVSAEAPTTKQPLKPKNIIICSDGTGNSAVKGRGTNVFKLYEAVDVVGGEGLAQQVAIYDDGVGTQKLKLIRAIAGAFGWGLARNVRQLYEELARTYEKGDQIYMFGFSRGAFTVRTLSGFVDSAKIIDASKLTAGQLSSAVGDEYRKYRKKNPAILELLTTPITNGLRALYRLLSKPFRPAERKVLKHEDVRIRFLGVWDTVDAVGFPVPGVATAWNTMVHRFKFKENNLRPCVEKAAHAMAIDEERASFDLYVFDHEEGRTEQVWFPGVHSNVGGGYPKQGISLVALEWMMTQAVAASEEGDRPKLRFQEGLRNIYREGQNPHDYLYDSRSGAAIYYRYGPRDIHSICANEDPQKAVPVKLHVSALERILKRPRGYSPGSVPDRFEVVCTPGSAGSSSILGHVELEEQPLPDETLDETPHEAIPVFSGAKDFWAKWRKGVQWVFYGVQVALLGFALATPAITDQVQADFDGARPAKVVQIVKLGEAVDWKVNLAKFVPWTRGVVENLVAPVPGEWVQQKIVRPMFLKWELGVAFVLLFPIAYYLGLLGRLRQRAINSHRWRHLKFRAVPAP